MARQASVTYEQVATVCNKIAAEGGTPGSRNVREVLGSGSLGTLLKYINQWKGGQERQSQAIDDTPDPSVVRAISNQIADRVQAATAEATARLVELQSETNNLIADAERQDALIEAQAEILATLQGEKATLAGRLAQVESDLARCAKDVSNERQAAEAARTDLAKAQLRLEAMPRLEAELLAIRAELAAERQSRVNAEQSAAVVAARLEASERRAREIEAERQKTEAQLVDVVQQREEALKRATIAAEALGNERVEHAKALDSARRQAVEEYRSKVEWQQEAELLAQRHQELAGERELRIPRNQKAMDELRAKVEKLEAKAEAERGGRTK